MKAKTSQKATGWRSSLAAVPGIGAALLPVGLCPACWPAYAGLLGSLGLGFLFEKTYLLPLTAFFLLVAVGALAYKARARRGYGPFFLGLLASAIIVTGKFLLETQPLVYAGVGILIAASFWNAWPKKKRGTMQGTCPACVPAGRNAGKNPSGARQIEGG